MGQAGGTQKEDVEGVWKLPESSSSEFDLPQTLILAELARILPSAGFRRAPQLQRFLDHVVTSTLTGQTTRLREFNLALDCFQRNPSRYDPHRDPIVRVAANRLRHKLKAYYEEEGADWYVKIALPVGTYVPTFAKRKELHRPGDNVSGTPWIPAAGSGHLPVRRETVSPEAKELANRGRFALRQQGIVSLRKAAEMFRRATQLDPEFAQAFSGLAMAQLGLIGMTAAPSLPDIGAAKATVQRALQIDPQLSEAYSSLASITFRYEFDWAGAEPLYRQAIHLAPGTRYAHHSYAFALTMNGRFAEADAEYQIARDLDPLDQNLRCQHALMPIYTGRYEAAEADLIAILDIDQDNLLARTLLGATWLHMGKPERALAEYEWAIGAAPDLSIGLCGKAQALALLGRREEATALLREMMARNDGQAVSAYQVAMIHARLGDDALTLEWLDRAGTQRDANFVCAPVDPTFERLRAGKAWAAMLHRNGLQPSQQAANQ